jgi:hypothetical protein
MEPNTTGASNIPSEPGDPAPITLAQINAHLVACRRCNPTRTAPTALNAKMLLTAQAVAIVHLVDGMQRSALSALRLLLLSLDRLVPELM